MEISSSTLPAVATDKPMQALSAIGECRATSQLDLLSSRVTNILTRSAARSGFCPATRRYDGFWLHRLLCARGIDNRILDAASILVDRRSRRAKTIGWMRRGCHVR